MDEQKYKQIIKELELVLLKYDVGIKAHYDDLILVDTDKANISLDECFNNEEN